ncbi:hypothetical protein KDL44_01345 [bacterium]|nr:hypothetical protein [bacterium]
MHCTEASSETELLAILLSDARQRASFLGNRRAWLAQKLQDPGTAGHLLDLDAVQLESQAATLVGKRWRAVSELIPESSLGNSSLTAALFREYADQYWPEGHRRHELDAVSFLRFCRGLGLRISTAELARLEISLGQRSFSLLPVRLQCGRRRKFGILLLIRGSGRNCRELLLSHI